MADDKPSKKQETKNEPARWSDLHVWQVQYVRDALMILGVIALFWLGQKLSIVTVPVLLAILFAYLFEPVIQFLMRKTRLKRQGAVTAIMVTLVLGVVVPGALALTYGVIQGAALVTTVAANTKALSTSVNAARDERIRQDELAALSEESDEPSSTEAVLQAQANLASARTAATASLQDLRETAGESWVDLHDYLIGTDERQNLTVALDIAGDWLEAEAGRVAQAAAGVGAGALGALLKFLSRAFGIMFMLFLTAFFFYFFATGWVEFKVFTRKLLPDKNREQIIHFAVQFDRIIAAFIRGRLTIAFIQSIVFTIGYWIIGVPAAFILGPVVAILSIVPYMALIGVPVAIVLLWLEDHTGLRGSLLFVLAAPTVFYFVAQALDDYVWTPMIQGKETGMSTPAILFASLAGGVLFGVFGLLIAIPIAACLKILIQEVFWPRFRAWAEGDAEDFLPITRE